MATKSVFTLPDLETPEVTPKHDLEFLSTMKVLAVIPFKPSLVPVQRKIKQIINEMPTKVTDFTSIYVKMPETYKGKVSEALGWLCLSRQVDVFIDNKSLCFMIEK